LAWKTSGWGAEAFMGVKVCTLAGAGRAHR